MRYNGRINGVLLESDVVVVGGGNAALCAALTANENGARVLVLESAPREFRGGNSRHTRNMRCMHAGPTEILTGAYTEEEYFADLLRVTGGETDEPLARTAIQESLKSTIWMKDCGVRFQPSLSGTLHLDRTNAFFLGGGKALLNSYYRTAERSGVRVAYDAFVERLDFDGDRCSALTVVSGGEERVIRPKAVVCASGGFEANIDWLARYWGDAAQN